jgi:hypothetical protein
VENANAALNEHKGGTARTAKLIHELGPRH